jgi:hypothetical protein
MMLESMHAQVKLYEEWMEVMDDYATVFSQSNSDDTNDDRNLQVKITIHYFFVLI